MGDAPSYSCPVCGENTQLNYHVENRQVGPLNLPFAVFDEESQRHLDSHAGKTVAVVPEAEPTELDVMAAQIDVIVNRAKRDPESARAFLEDQGVQPQGTDAKAERI